MMDITKLIDDYAIYWISREDTRNTEVRNKILSHISAMQEVCDKVKEVYEKYKHLDELLSDREFLDEKNIKAMILYDLWQAIKE